MERKVPARNPLTLLILEDVVEEADLVVNALRDQAIEVDWGLAMNEKELLEKLRGRAYDAVICDYVMPDLDWRTALRAVHETGRDVPFLVISGHKGIEYAVETIRGGCHDYVLKDELIRLGPALLREVADAEERRASAEARARLADRLSSARRLEAAGLIAAGIGHDLNNLLTILTAELDLATLDHPIEPWLTESVRAAERAGALARRLTALDDIVGFDPRPTDVALLVDRIAGLLRSALPKSIRLDVVVAERMPPLELDAPLIEDALINLGLNGRDAIDDGGELILRAALAAAATPDAAPELVIEVLDTGHGMPEGIQRRIFDPFFTTRPEGSGLGLTVVRRCVNAHGGTVEVESKEGDGSRFVLRLPTRRATAPASPEAASSPRGDERLLVVDENEGVLLVSARLLRSLGYRVDTASTVEDALAVARAHAAEIDLILTDLTIAGGGAARLLGQLHGEGIEVPVVLMSSFATGGRSAALAEGFAGQIQKPFRRDDLAARVRDVLDRESGTREPR